MSAWQTIDWCGALGAAMVFGTIGYWVSAVLRVRVPVNLNPVRGVLVIGGLLSLSAAVSSSQIPSAISLTGFALAFLFMCLDRIAAMPRRKPDIAVGSPVPAFSAPTSEGGEFSLDVPPGHPVLLKFFRGHW